jgi:hypothetical protein
MAYIKVSDSTRHEIYAIRAAFPHMSIPDSADLSDLGFLPVIEAGRPDFDPMTHALEENYIEDDDCYRQTWTVVELSPSQRAEKLAIASSTIILRIDQDVDAVYASAVGNRATEYQKAEEQARSYRAVGYSGDVPKAVAAWANATGKSAQWAADDIIATADAWHAAEDAIREQRLMCKQLARNATTDAALNLVRIQWSAFLTQIRAQLSD